MKHNHIWRRLTVPFLAIAFVLSLMATSPVTAAVPAAPDASVACTLMFINEIHYDNTGTDAGEFIEVAGLAGTDLTGWSVVLYNGSSGAAYDTDSLSGTMTDESMGYGTVVIDYPSNGIQNGSPDGIALVHDGVAVQFLSYEGSFVAIGGPADGMISTDIGVLEDGADPVGYSLQLTGTGSCYEDFTWASPAANTHDSLNTGQTFEDLAPFIVSHTPEADATNVPTNTTIVLNFSKRVDLTVDAVTLDCRGPVSFSGLPATDVTTVTLTPDTVLPYEAYCVVTVYAAEVTDSDAYDPPDQMDVDYTFNFVVAPEEVAPSVSSTFPVDNATSVAFDSSIFIVFSEPVTVGADWFDITCSVSGAHPAIVADADPIFVLNPNTDFLAGETCTVTIVAAAVTDDDTEDPPDNMEADYTFDFTVTNGICGDPAVGIHTVQGNGAASAFDGYRVAIEGVVVGDFHTDSNFNMFFVQEEDADADGDPTTSEGIAIYDGSSPAVDVAIGDVVRVAGTVDEYNGLTELTGVTVTKCGSGSATPASLTLPVSSLDDFEAAEGMRVTFPQTMTVAEHYNLARYGEILLSGEGRLFQFTHDNLPDVTGYTDFLNSLPLRTILLDDRVSTQNPDPVIHPFARLEYTNTLRLGDYVQDLSGVLSYSFGVYRILPDQGVTFTHANERPESTPDVGGTFQVASMNVLNYFNTFSGCTAGVGGEAVDCRGANSIAEFERQRDKIVDAILRMDASVVGLMEIENDGYGADSALRDLINGLNAVAGADTYAMIDADASIGVTNTLGTDAIKVAMIYQPARVTPVGASATISDTLFERHPLAQAFQENSTGAVFTVVVNHFKSKGCTDATGLDMDLGDGQSCYNARRTEQAQALVDWLATDPLGVDDPDYLIIGDLNSYKLEDPIQVFLTANYVDLLDAFEGAGAYSYVFDGQLGYLDHALASPSLAAQVHAANHWHINADEPRALDYNVEFKSVDQQDYFYDPAAFRSSDHDPVLVGMALRFRSMLFMPLVANNTAP